MSDLLRSSPRYYGPRQFTRLVPLLRSLRSMTSAWLTLVTMLLRGSGFPMGESQWADQFAPAEVRHLPGHLRPASLGCRILRSGITRSRTAQMTAALWWALQPPHFSAATVC